MLYKPTAPVLGVAFAPATPERHQITGLASCITAVMTPCFNHVTQCVWVTNSITFADKPLDNQHDPYKEGSQFCT